MGTIAILRLAIINTVGFSASTVMPLWLGGIAAQFGMPAWFAGVAVAIQLGAAALFNLATPLLFRNMLLLPLARYAMGVAGMAFLLALVPSPAVFLVAALLSGGALGTSLNVINRLMGSNEHVQHGYALFVLMEVVVATILFLAGAALIERFGLMAIFVELAAAAGFALLILLHFPTGSNMPSAVGQTDPSANPRAGLIGLGAFAFFFVGQATINSFMPVIGQAAGLSSAAANQIIGLGMPFGFLGGMLARFVGERVKPVMPVVAVTMLLACIAPGLTLMPDPSIFRVGVIALACSTMFVVPYFFAQLGASDHSGRFTAFGPAMMLTGLAIGPGIAVMLKSRFGIEAVGLFSSSMLVLGGCASLLARRTAGTARGALDSQLSGRDEMEDIETGCEGAVAALKDWIAALMAGNVDRLETILAPEYQFTCSPDIIPGGRLDKSAFIEMDRKIRNSTIEIRKLAARRFDDTVMTMVFAEVHEEVAGNLGPGMPSAEEMSAKVNGHVFAYASAWRKDGGQWQCTSHNVIATAR
ncbi:DUF4440 domain-containing protein [Sphingomonas histidinilytica]|jgi:hypothetical protein|uniref:DUF4440 domain-containing protein n=1 Tax=Rhizorhabdus histidinilytica TaxID=439228 RepID=UPI000F7735A6|nr:DUF4440 domain-containing protein [Rhizorhabdus histidinilytica]MBO9376430.1 DUF4440 domain-containing protein [Rhizorhabdus histidinilytica]QEH79223.1 DUF4440 domain-containing protein [Sphingomonas sp. C8-2]